MLRVFLKVHRCGLLLAASVLLSLNAHAQTSQVKATCSAATLPQGPLLNEVHTVADPSQGVPVECSFDVAVAGAYNVTLTDLGTVPGSSPATPAPLDSVQLAITSGGTLVDVTLKAPGTVQFNATVGTYVIRVVGKPSSQLGSGPIGIAVTSAADNSVLASFSSALSFPSQMTQANEALLDDSFTVASDGTYVVTVTDLQLPQPLQTLILAVTALDGTIVTIPPLSAAGSVNVTLTHGVTYRIFGAALANASANAGLFSATVTPTGGGAPAYSKTIPVGGVSSAGSVTLVGGGSYTFKLTDLALPAALTSVAAVVVENGQSVANLPAPGSSTAFTAAAGTYQVFVAATAATAAPAAGLGSYAISLDQVGSSSALSFARAVGAAGTSGPNAYSYDAIASSAGGYSLNLADFSFPRSFVSLEAVVVQAGAAVGAPIAVPGTQPITVAAGPLSVLVFAQGDMAGSLFGVDLTAGAGATPLLAATQGVGQLFVSRQFSITAAGNYAVNVADVKFPAALATFAVVVTSGSKAVGQIFGGGAFNFPATPGNYFVNFIAQPDSTALAGTYALNVSAGPSATLTSSATTVGSGGTVHLTWSSQNATSCTASGGWSGTLGAQGAQDSPAVTSDTTFTLTCSGENTNAVSSVVVTVSSPPPSAGGGGGGALDLGVLAGLLGLLAARSYIRHGR